MIHPSLEQLFETILFSCLMRPTSAVWSKFSAGMFRFASLHKYRPEEVKRLSMNPASQHFLPLRPGVASSSKSLDNPTKYHASISAVCFVAAFRYLCREEAPCQRFLGERRTAPTSAGHSETAGCLEAILHSDPVVAH